MSYNHCFGNFSHSLGGCVCYLVSSCGSSSPSRVVYSTGLCSPSTCQLGFSLYRDCEPSSCQPSCAVPSPCQLFCYRPRTSMICSPCQSTYTGSLGFRSKSSCSLGYRSRSCYSQGCGSNGFRPLSYGVHGFPFLG
nr:keratin-associated protein 13-1-like [Loxodonta africana]